MSKKIKIVEIKTNKKIVIYSNDINFIISS